ncbi:hypothetical protein HK101_008362 [Irineochytrium annulatum]|nr:hypothetical protein HK101_008362 [Irineochytrium annulatum]
MLAQVIAAATHLTQIDMLVLHQNSCDYVSGLLQASRATLSDVTLHIETVPYLSLLPIRKLSHLETLKLNFGFDLVGDIQLRWLKTMQSLRKLSINARNWEFKHLEALLEDVEIISVLELHIQLRDCLDDNEDNHLSVTFANLREVSLKWSSKAGLSLKGFEGGLPFLEDISIQVHFFADSRSTVERKLWELKESFMRLVEVSMSLSLAYAIIKLGCDDVHYDTWRWRAVDHYAEE